MPMGARPTEKTPLPYSHWPTLKRVTEMQKHTGSFDFILDAVSADHDLNAYLNLLKRDGTLVFGGSAAKSYAYRGFRAHYGQTQSRRLRNRRNS
jgi:D-arabinose 1-dehydrogenase-like Zn-dependent alcohol dehydrogenase